jgi:twitching motility protein PilT
MSLYHKLLSFQIELDGSDMWLSSNEKPRIRRYGKIVPMCEFEASLDFFFSRNELEDIISNIAEEQGLARKWKDHGSFDFSFRHEGVGFRGCVSRQLNGPILSLRRLAPLPEDVSVLGIPKQVMALTEFRQGLVLVTGPTGSGKTTTLACLLNHIGKNRSVHVVTLEDPIEYIIESGGSLFTQKQVGRDVPSFSDGIRISLRENPDVIVVGEMRDLETMRRAIEASSTGHLVFATLHTSSSVETISRILNVFPAEEGRMIRDMLADNIQAVVSQLLFPRADQPGLVAAFELFRATKAARNIIREEKTVQLRNVIESGQREGMFLMEDFLARLVSDGKVKREDALVAVSDPDFLRGKIH